MSETLTPAQLEVNAFNVLLTEFDHQPGVDVTLSRSKNGPVTYWSLDRLVVRKESRNNGTGTTIMHRICALADQHGVILALSPTSEFGGSKTRLIKFYKRFGFVSNRKRSGRDYWVKETMIRNPNA